MKKIISVVLIAFVCVQLSNAQDLSSESISLDCQVDVTLGKGYTTSKMFVIDDDQFLFCHNSNTGQTSVWNLTQGGEPVLESKWSTGWTNINFYKVGVVVYFFHHKNGTGLTRINKLDYNSIMSGRSMGTKVYEETWSKGWTTTEFFEVNDRVYFLHYKKSSGLIRINAIKTTQAHGVGNKIYEKTWSKDYTNFAMTANGDNFFILYQKGDEGTCVINKVNLVKLEAAAEGGLVTPDLGKESYRKKWSAGWDNLMFFTLNDKVYLLHNKPKDGLIRMSELTAEGTLGEKRYEKKWSSGWDRIDIFYKNGNPQLFHQKSSTGKTKICELKN